MRDVILLSVKGVKKYYSGITGFNRLVLDEVSFLIHKDENTGRIVSVLAPFGAGKSTLLKVISALEKPDSGEIILSGKEYSTAAGEIVYLPENPSSFPWYNVRANVELPLKSSHINFSDSINNIISVVGLSGYEDHFPHNKSLGFRFRISLARALAVNPKLILLDDSFRNMDAVTRGELYNLVVTICRELKINFLTATTNIHEAIFLSDEILLMKKNPGSIFKQINNENELFKKDFKVTEELISFRNEIEQYFRKEQVLETTIFSI